MKRFVSLGSKTSAVVLVGFALSACVQTSTQNAPTHRWEAAGAADEVQYRNDHARCQAQAELNGESKAYDAQNEQFVEYKQCMTNRGYVLTAYRD